MAKREPCWACGHVPETPKEIEQRTAALAAMQPRKATREELVALFGLLVEHMLCRLKSGDKVSPSFMTEVRELLKGCGLSGEIANLVRVQEGLKRLGYELEKEAEDTLGLPFSPTGRKRTAD